MARIMSMGTLLLLLILLAGCTVTATFDFAAPAVTGAPASNAAPTPTAIATGPATPASNATLETPPGVTPDVIPNTTSTATQTISAVGLYNTAANQLLDESRWYVPNETKYRRGALQVSGGSDLELSRQTPKLILGRVVEAGATITRPLNTGDAIPAWKVLMAGATITECEPASNLVWRETAVDVSDPENRTMTVMDWPVAEICPLRNDELGNLMSDSLPSTLWVDFMVAGNEQTTLYRFVPLLEEDPGSVDEQTSFCEWIDCSGWVGGVACKVLQCP